VLTVNSLFGSTGVGIYAVAKQVSGAIRKFSSFSSLVSFVEFSRMTARGEYRERARLFQHVLAISAAVGAVAVVAVTILGEPILVYGFGPKYAAGYWTLVALMVAAAAQFVMNPVNMRVQIVRGALPAMMCNVAALAAFGLSLLPLAWGLGPEGVAVALIVYSLVVIGVGGWLIHTERPYHDYISEVPR
jgi:O-antigen/teichoic acid export membrane protein